MPTKKKATVPAAPVIQLADISGFTIAQAATGFADRYVTKTRIFVEMGKLANHITRQKLKKGQSLYGILRAKDVPEGTVNNAVRASKFLDTFVHTGLVSESRFDEIITFRIANQAIRITEGKAAKTFTPEELTTLLNSGEKSAIGEELDSLAEHGLTIAEREADAQARIAEEERIAAANAAAAKLPAETPENISDETTATPPATTPPAPAEKPKGKSAPAGKPAAKDESTDNVVPITGQSSHDNRGDLAGILAQIDAAQLQSFDLSDDDRKVVAEKLQDWIGLMESSVNAYVAF